MKKQNEQQHTRTNTMVINNCDWIIFDVLTTELSASHFQEIQLLAEMNFMPFNISRSLRPIDVTMLVA